MVDETDRELHLCDADGITVDITDVGIRAPGFTFTAYVLWDAMPEHQGDFLLGEGRLDSHVGALITAAREQLREHFKLRAVEQRREVVQQWKTDGVYPYQGEAATDTDAVERETFDVIATTVHRKIPRTAKQLRTTLTLLREVVRHQPDNMHQLLDEMFNLTVDDKAALKTLLDRTSLATVIKASTSVTDRLTFLTALEHMVFEPEIRKVLKERSQLHKILENEVWVFGEHFNLLVSDRSLDAVLDRHLASLGRDNRAPTPVRRLDGRKGIVDLMLSRARKEHGRRWGKNCWGNWPKARSPASVSGESAERPAVIPRRKRTVASSDCASLGNPARTRRKVRRNASSSKSCTEVPSVTSRS
jgi:hypothetical protein